MNQSESRICIIRPQYSDNKPWADIFAWLVFGRDYCREVHICFRLSGFLLERKRWCFGKCFGVMKPKTRPSSLNKDYTPLRTRSFGTVSSLFANPYVRLLHLILVSDFSTYRQPHTTQGNIQFNFRLSL